MTQRHLALAAGAASTTRIQLHLPQLIARWLLICSSVQPASWTIFNACLKMAKFLLQAHRLWVSSLSLNQHESRGSLSVHQQQHWLIAERCESLLKLIYVVNRFVVYLLNYIAHLQSAGRGTGRIYVRHYHS
jgi:hypothetical protein